jgi:serine/threonine protein kinase
MAKVCPTCGRSYPSEQTLCPADGADLVEKGPQTSAYDVTHHSTPGVDATGIPLPAPPLRESSSPSSTLAYSGSSQLSLTPAPDGREIGSQPGVPRNLSTNSGLRPVGTGRELSTPGISVQDIQISPGDMVNEYKITGRLGEGGMGTVYEGIQPVIGKQVAIKVLLREYASNEEVVNRFIQEARAVNQAHSRYIVDIFSFGELCDGRHYFVMEYLDGKSLREVLDDQKVLSFDEAYAILSCMAKGLAAAHKVGIIHRDIKPENIVVMREADGTISAKVLDFGIAKLQGDQANPSFVTKTGAALGTPYYMSPEQCRGQDVDHRTDVYALGIITFEMFAGALPYTASSYIELVNKHLFASPPNPSEMNADITGQLEAFILRCIAKNPEERPQSMAQFRSELAELVPSLHKTHPTSVRMPAVHKTPTTVGSAEAQGKQGGGRLGLMLGLLGLLVLAGVGVGAYVWYASRPPDGGGGATTKKGTGPVATADSGGNTTAPVTSGKLKLTSAPVGAAVLVDGVKQQGVTPLTLELKPGKHKLLLLKAGHKERELTLVIEVGKERAEAVSLEVSAPPAADVSALSVQADHRATFFLDGKQMYVGSLFKLDKLKPGKYEIKIKAKGRRDQVEIIELKPGETFNKAYKLRRKGGGGKRPPRTHSGTKKPGQKKVDDKDDTLNPFGKKK